MNNIQMKGVNSTLSQVVSEDVQYLKQHLDNVLLGSDQTLIENLIEETEFSLEAAKDASKTYQERHDIFDKLTQSLFNVWNRYKNTPEAIDLIRSLDRMTNYSMAYSYLCLSLSHINEGRTGEYKTDLKRIVSGFLLLSEIVDVFIDFFSPSELKQIYEGATNATSVSTRDTIEYFENGLELSNLVTQLRAYSSLLTSKIEKHLKDTKSTLEAAITEPKNQTEIDFSTTASPWWNQIAGTFADNSAYDESIRLGREYRGSLRGSGVLGEE